MGGWVGGWGAQTHTRLPAALSKIDTQARYCAHLQQSVSKSGTQAGYCGRLQQYRRSAPTPGTAGTALACSSLANCPRYAACMRQLATLRKASSAEAVLRLAGSALSNLRGGGGAAGHGEEWIGRGLGRVQRPRGAVREQSPHADSAAQPANKTNSNNKQRPTQQAHDPPQSCSAASPRQIGPRVRQSVRVVRVAALHNGGVEANKARLAGQVLIGRFTHHLRRLGRRVG